MYASKSSSMNLEKYIPRKGSLCQKISKVQPIENKITKKGVGKPPRNIPRGRKDFWKNFRVYLWETGGKDCNVMGRKFLGILCFRD